MMGEAFAAALVLSVSVWLWRRYRKRQQHRSAAKLPGRSVEAALRIPNWREMDDLARAERCVCGGAMLILGERSVVHREQELRVIRLECLRCEEVSELWFDLAGVYH